MGDWAQALFEEQAKKSNAAIEVIKKLNIPKVGKNLEIRKMVWGGGEACLESAAIVHPELGKLVVSRRILQKYIKI